MNVGEMCTRIKMATNGFENVELEDLDKPYMYQAIGESVLGLKKTLRLPITEKDVAVVAGERGFSLPTNWIEWIDEMTAIRLDPGRVLTSHPLTLGDAAELTLGDAADITLGEAGDIIRMDVNGFTNTIGYNVERTDEGQDSEGTYLTIVPEYDLIS